MHQADDCEENSIPVWRRENTEMNNTDTFTLKEIISRLERMGIDDPLSAKVDLTDGEKFVPVDGFFFVNNTICLISDKVEADRDEFTQRVRELEEVLKPFAHPDLSAIMSGNADGVESPVFGRNRAQLKIKHFKKAKELLS
jgi:hypothetical protein